MLPCHVLDALLQAKFSGGCHDQLFRVQPDDIGSERLFECWIGMVTQPLIDDGPSVPFQCRAEMPHGTEKHHDPRFMRPHIVGFGWNLRHPDAIPPRIEVVVNAGIAV